ncbi:hypothetical protein ACE38V_17325 [Cytobacillus sp. Hz8]|uniref:hypothetical protein n=1 Tax=Cytobacillus sp. Hz8 TaxID=3347168 RepID=UPI0035D556EC
METKIPFYNILNMLLTGFIFVGCCIFIYINTFLHLLISNAFPKISFGSETIITISFFSVIYEIGYIINRIGSIVTEPILKKTKAIPFDNDYKKFNDCKKQYPILSTLSREYALSRTTLTLFLITTVLAAFQKQWILALIFILIAVLFSLSCRKHAKKIVDIMK